MHKGTKAHPQIERQARPPKGKDRTGRRTAGQLKRWQHTRESQGYGRPDVWTLDDLIPDVPGMFTKWRKALKLSAVKAGALIGLSRRHAQRLDAEGWPLDVRTRRAMLDALMEKHAKGTRRKAVQKYLH